MFLLYLVPIISSYRLKYAFAQYLSKESLNLLDFFMEIVIKETRLLRVQLLIGYGQACPVMSKLEKMIIIQTG